MKRVLSMAAAVLLVSGVSATAQSFEFEVEGEVEGSVSYTESFEFTETNGAEFNFNGGAGSNFDANTNGAIAGVDGVNGQFVGGAGQAFSDTDFGEFATAAYSSGSFAAAGGFASDRAFDDWAQIDGNGLVQAGGAGSVTTGVSTGYDLEFDANLTGELDLSYGESFTTNP